MRMLAAFILVTGTLWVVARRPVPVPPDVFDMAFTAEDD